MELTCREKIEFTLGGIVVVFIIFWSLFGPKIQNDWKNQESTQYVVENNDIDQNVRPKALELCNQAFLNSNPLPDIKSPIGKSVVIYDIGVYSLWNIENYSIKTLTKKSNEVASIICVHEIRGMAINYKSSNGNNTDSLARTDWDVRILNWPDGTVIGGKLFIGDEPPDNYSILAGHGWEDVKYLDDFYKWINSLPK